MVSRKFVLIVVEGNHDQACVQRILRKKLRLSEVKNFDDMKPDFPKIWRKFAPEYRQGEGRLHTRLNMPAIFEGSNLSVAVYWGEGSNLVRNLKLRIKDLDPEEYEPLYAVGMIVDSDKQSVSQIVSYYHEKLKNILPNLPNQTAKGGIIADGEIRSGIYILPDNESQGVLDTILCKCGKFAYGDYWDRAVDYISSFQQEDRSRIGVKWKPFDREKATIAALVSILKPGKSNTVSLADDDWISEDTIAQVPELQSLVDFIERLCQ